MTNAIDNAVERLQDFALGMTGITIKSAPDYPIENADPLPMCVAYGASGNFYSVNASTLLNFPNIIVEFHFSRVNLKQMAQQINAVIFEYPKRIANDPTLDGSVDTVVMTQGQPLEYTSRPFAFGSVQTQMLQFTVPVKLLQAPQATST